MTLNCTFTKNIFVFVNVIPAEHKTTSATLQSRPAFLVAAGLACVATVLAGILAWRTRGVYRKTQVSADPERVGGAAAADAAGDTVSAPGAVQQL